MVRKVIIILLLLALLGGAYLQSSYINSTVDELLLLTGEVETAFYAGDMAGAERALDALLQCWEGHENPMSMLLEHAEVDHIHEEMGTLGANVTAGVTEEIPAALTRLKYYLAHLVDMDAIKLANIL